MHVEQMKKILIEKSYKGPAINFDGEKGLIEIKGCSILENPRTFYEPLVDKWLDEYISNPKEKTVVNIELEYFNTSSSMWIFQILKKLGGLYKKNKEVTVNWYYFDEDMLEIAEDYEALISIPFNMIDIKSSQGN